jgi:membrane protease YdiL (CAAX protease family)
MLAGDADWSTRAVRRTTALFLVLAFALDWTCWLAAGVRSGWVIDESDCIWSPLLAASMFGPLISAVIVCAKGKARVDVGWRPNLRGGLRWYLLALALPPALTLAGSALYFLLVPGDFDPEATCFSVAAAAQLGVGRDQVPAIMAIQVVSSAALAPFVNMAFAIGEEAGWRGLLYPVLRERMPRSHAAALAGVAWGAWHAPLIAMGYNYGTDYQGFPVIGILAMTIFCVAFGMVLCLLRERSGSVWPCALAHGSLNAVAGLGIWFSRGGSGILGPIPLGLIGCIPAAALSIWLMRRLDAPAPERGRRDSH